MDDRIVKFSVIVNDKLHTYEGLEITAKGVKSGNFIQNECSFTISNIDKETRDFLLTEGSPFNRISNRTRPFCRLEVGRVSYGTFIMYQGDIALVSVTQPPDIKLTIKCLTSNWGKGIMVEKTEAPVASLSTIAASIAKDLGLPLLFQADDKQISNYSYSGPATGQIEKLYRMGDYDAYVDDDKLVVVNRNKALSNSIRILDLDNGLIGIPEFIDYGIRVKMLIDPFTKVGMELQVTSLIYPAVNGTYKIRKLEFDVANRGIPFYYIAEGARV